MGDAVDRLFHNAGRATEASLEIKVIAVIRSVVSRSVVESFRNSVFQNATERVAHKYLARRYVINDVVAPTIDVHSLTVAGTQFC